MRQQRTVTISLPPALSKQVDSLARREGRTRSELVREALRQYMDRTERWQRIFAFGEELARRGGLSERDVAHTVKRARRAPAR
ncbi:hypothetical protein BH20ACT24_BH20ACT24_24080 [soil metagenome]